MLPGVPLYIFQISLFYINGGRFNFDAAPTT
jgi:hypothetical protein